MVFFKVDKMIHSLYNELISIYSLIRYFYFKRKRISKFNKIKKQRKSLENKINPYINKNSSYDIKKYPPYLKINRTIDYLPRDHIF